MSYNPEDYDYSIIIKKIEKFVLQKVMESNSNGIVIGLSGGIDSSVCLGLASRSIPKHNILGLIMPMEGITPEEDEIDAIDLAKQFNVEYRIIKLNKISQEYMKKLNKHKIAQGNLLARIRMSILYYHANLLNRIVIGTGDKSEYMLGYFTKFGDGAADIAPIADLFKTQVRILSKKLEISHKITNKKSGPRLWENHNAEDELQMTYEDVDELLYSLITNNLDEEHLSKQKLKFIKLINKRIKDNKHKKELPEICKIN